MAEPKNKMLGTMEPPYAVKKKFIKILSNAPLNATCHLPTVWKLCAHAIKQTFLFAKLEAAKVTFCKLF